MLRCREVVQLVASGEIERAPWGRRLAVSFHLLMCRHCRRYARQLAALGAAARRLYGQAPASPAAVEQEILARIHRPPASGGGA